MDRRFFLKSTSVLSVGFLTLPFLSSCSNGGGGSSGTGATATMNCSTTDPVTALTQGAHSSDPHTLSLTQMQINDGINSGVDQVFNLSTASGHSHTVTITVAQLQMLQANQSVMGLVSSQTGHTHPIDIVCG